MQPSILSSKQKLRLRVFFERKNGNEGFSAGFFLELNRAVNQREKGVILTHSDIHAGIMDRTSLADDDIAGFGELTAENFDT